MKINSIKSTFIYPLIFSSLCSTTAFAQSAPSVPAQYIKPYASISQAIDTFITSLDSRSQPAGSTSYGSGLDMARSGHGLGLLTKTGMDKVQTELNCFHQLGITAVTIEIGFPILCPQFWGSDTKDFQAMLNVYQQVVLACHALGMKVIVETHAGPGDGDTAYAARASHFVHSLSAPVFQQYMAEHVYNVASYARPDVISIVNETNTDLAWTGQAVYKEPATLGPSCK